MMSRRSLQQKLSLALVLLLTLAMLSGTEGSQAAPQNQDADAPRSTAPRDFTTRNFIMHTDLPEDEAREELEKLETMLGLISAYWGRASNAPIEMYVVRDLKNWPEDSLHPTGLAKIKGRAGVTISQKITSGNRFISKAVVYAVAERGVARHEAVHAYCHQAFGTVGPVWYSEGMAEMGQYWVKDDLSVNAHEVVIDYLQESDPRPVAEIVDDAEKNSQTGDSWQSYAWRWALCHVLEVNPNYRRKFRTLGLNYLSGRKIPFDNVFGQEMDQLDFEYRFFLEHLDKGFRVDLCAWDWSKRFTLVSGRRTLTSRISADRGWQPSMAQLRQGETYTVTATGNWKLAKDGDQIPPSGDEQGKGKLQGVLLTEGYQLTEPFDIGAEATFTAKTDGRLYFRCADDWSELEDNSGRIAVKTTLAANAK